MRTDSYGSRTPAGATRGAGRSSPISAKRSSIKLIARASHAPVYGATQIAGERYGLQVVTWEGRASETPDAWARRHAGEDSETSTNGFGHARARGPASRPGWITGAVVAAVASVRREEAQWRVVLARSVLEVLSSLEAAGCRVWVAGGWGVDALVGERYPWSWAPRGSRRWLVRVSPWFFRDRQHRRRSDALSLGRAAVCASARATSCAMPTGMTCRCLRQSSPHSVPGRFRFASSRRWSASRSRPDRRLAC